MAAPNSIPIVTQPPLVCMRRAFVYTNERMYEGEDGILRTENPEIIVPLAEVFELIA